MNYQASSDWDLHFHDEDSLASAATELGDARGVSAAVRERVIAAIAGVTEVQDVGFDDAAGLHLTGWTGGTISVRGCDALMATLAGRATGTVDWSDGEGNHWRDRLTMDGYWHQLPGLVVYPEDTGGPLITRTVSAANLPVPYLTFGTNRGLVK